MAYLIMMVMGGGAVICHRQTARHECQAKQQKRPHDNRQTNDGKQRADKEIVKHDHAHRDYAGRDYAHACQGDRSR